MTLRAVITGLLGVVLIDLVEAYNDDVLYNSLLIGNHFPLVTIVAVMALVFGVNAGLARWTRIRRFAAGELVLIWSMLGVGCGIAGSGLMRYLPTWLAVPAYYTTASNEWAEYVLKDLPSWMVLSRDPNSPAVRWLMEGLPRGARIPWGAWVVPLGIWVGFMVLLYAASFCLVSLFYRQWADRERLVFPLVQVPLLIAEEAPPGGRLNMFFRNPVTWAGLAIPAVIWGVNGLAIYLPVLPRIPMSVAAPAFFPDRPWSEFQLAPLSTSFTVIGMTFLLPAETAFSLWFFYVLYRLSFVYIAWLGAGGTGYWAAWDTKLAVFDTAGAMLVIAAALVWAARGFLRGWWKRAMTGRPDPVQDPLPPRLSLVLLTAAFGGMFAWFVAAGVQWWAAIATVAMFLVMLLVLTRVVAEAGLVFVQTTAVPFDLIAGLVPASWLTGATLNVLNMQKAIVMQDLRESMLPYLMNGANGGARTRMPLGRLLAILALTAGVGLGVSAYSRITTTYKYGAVNMDQWSAVWSVPEFLGGLVDFRKSPPEVEWIHTGDKRVIPVNAAHMACGGLLTGAMLVLRARFLWWPLHPFGLVMCGSWAMSVIWFSIFLGWVAKSSVMSLGGATVYRKILPFFLGMVLGESAMLAFWSLLALARGAPAGVTVLGG